jgi:hypothetical protein
MWVSRGKQEIRVMIPRLSANYLFLIVPTDTNTRVLKWSVISKL